MLSQVLTVSQSLTLSFFWSLCLLTPDETEEILSGQVLI